MAYNYILVTSSYQNHCYDICRKIQNRCSSIQEKLLLIVALLFNQNLSYCFYICEKINTLTQLTVRKTYLNCCFVRRPCLYYYFFQIFKVPQTYNNKVFRQFVIYKLIKCTNNNFQDIMQFLKFFFKGVVSESENYHTL